MSAGGSSRIWLFRGATILLVLVGVAGIAQVAGRIVVARSRDNCGTDLCEQVSWVESHNPASLSSVGGYLPDPLLGWLPLPDQKPRPEFASRITTDSRGVRGAHEYPTARGPKRRVLVLGDSFTFGVCVDDEQSWPAQLERILPDTEVINFAVPGYGLDQMLLHWERDGVAYKPDVVVLGYIANDLERSVSAFHFYAKPLFLPDGDGLRLTSTPVPTPSALFAQESTPRKRWLHFAELGMQLDHFGNPRTDRALREKVSQRILDRLIAGVRAVGATPVIVFLPTQPEIAAAEEHDPPSPFLPRTCAATHTTCLDATDGILRFIQANPRPDYFRCHYSPELCRHTAELVAANVLPLLPERAAPHD